MSFHEKSAWACLLVIALVYVPYFAFVLQFPMAGLGLIWVSTVGVVVLLSVFHAVNALASRAMRRSGPPPFDEMDRTIELNAAKWAGFILAFAVVSWVLVAMFLLPMIGSGAMREAKATGVDVSDANFTVPVLTAMTAVHYLFAGFVFANLVYYGGIVFGYRRMGG